jgi:hypothetical protein
MSDSSKLPIPTERHRGAPAQIGDNYELQAQGTEIDAGRMPSVQAAQASGSAP